MSKMPVWGWALIGVGCVAPLVLFGGCVLFAGGVATSVSKSVEEATKNRASETLSWDANNFTYSRDALDMLHVKGAVINKGTKAAPYVEIKFQGFDKTGAQVDTGFSNTTDLAPGGVWKFDVALGKDTKTAKLLNVSTSPLSK